MEFDRVGDLFGRAQWDPLDRLRELEADMEDFDRLQAAARASNGGSRSAPHAGSSPRRIPTRAGRRPECVRSIGRR
jgi:hypothetical protein